MTKAELIEAVHKFDLIIQPYALYCNPADETEIKEIIPESVKLIPIAFIEKGKMFLVDRAEIEKDLFGGREMKYKAGDIVKNPTFEEMDEILDNYNAEWVGIGILKIVSEKEVENADSN